MFYRAGIIVLLSSATALFGGSDGATSPAENSAVVATVNGKPVTLADFERDRPLALFQARNAYYEAEKKAVEAYMDDYLLELQARKEGLTVEKLIDLHVASKIAPEPSDAALEVYYEGLDTNESFTTMKTKIRDHLRERRVGRAKQAYVLSLRGEAEIAVTLTQPRAPVSPGSAPARGAANAPLTLIEYADYECPYCQQLDPDMRKIEADYSGRIRFVYKDFPLPMHSHAQKAAEAAHCAGNQNKYWEFHDAMLASKQLDLPQLKGTAQQLGLDTKAFDACLDSGAGVDPVKANMEEATQLGLTGTPSFFLNGRFISGGPTYEQFHQLLDEELKAVASPQRQALKQ
jgi:protein-disulfide isomerase